MHVTSRAVSTCPYTLFFTRRVWVCTSFLSCTHHMSTLNMHSLHAARTMQPLLGRCLLDTSKDNWSPAQRKLVIHLARFCRLNPRITMAICSDLVNHAPKVDPSDSSTVFWRSLCVALRKHAPSQKEVHARNGRLIEAPVPSCNECGRRRCSR